MNSITLSDGKTYNAIPCKRHACNKCELNNNPICAEIPPAFCMDRHWSSTRAPATVSHPSGSLGEEVELE